MPKGKKIAKEHILEKDLIGELVNGIELPPLEWFVGQKRGMNEMIEVARPHFERLQDERNDARAAVNVVREQAIEQYNKQLEAFQDKAKDAIQHNQEGSIRTFLNALKHDEIKNTGVKQGMFVRNAETGMPMHLLPTQKALFDEDISQYFPGAQSTYTTPENASRAIKDAFDNAATFNTWARLGGLGGGSPKKISTLNLIANLDKYEGHFPRHKPPGVGFGTNELKGLLSEKDHTGRVIRQTPVLVSWLSDFPAEAISSDIIGRLGERPFTAPSAELLLPTIDELLGPAEDTDLSALVPRH